MTIKLRLFDRNFERLQWGGKFWSSGYYVSTVSEKGNEKVIANYVKNQGNEYKKLYRNNEIEGQLSLYDYE